MLGSEWDIYTPAPLLKAQISSQKGSTFKIQKVGKVTTKAMVFNSDSWASPHDIVEPD